MSIKSVVAINLGAENTGAFFINHPSDAAPDAKDAYAAAFIHPMTASGGEQFSCKERTGNRHHKRTIQRYKLARRLLRLAVCSAIERSGHTVSDEDMTAMNEALRGLLKRRGFTRLAFELDVDKLDLLPPETLAAYGPTKDFFTADGGDVSEQLNRLAEDMPSVRRLYENSKRKGFAEGFADMLKRSFRNLEISASEGKQAFRQLISAVSDLVMQNVMGHHHRTEYLKRLAAEVNHDSRLTPAVMALGSDPQKLCRLVGNISNLQLRALRWYFNDPKMRKGDVWIESRLRDCIVRGLKYQRPEPEKRALHRDLIRAISTSTDIVETLCGIDPVLTIPPYERQNNRRPPVDQTLYLNPHALYERYGDAWRTWAHKFRTHDPVLAEKLDTISAMIDRESRVGIADIQGGGMYFDSFLLQRVLDRAKPRDVFRLRSLARCEDGRMPASLQECRDRLAAVLGTQHVNGFLDLARDYYEETQIARSGLWESLQGSVLERSNIHPKQKSKVLDLLVGNVFGQDAEFGARFISDMWSMRIKHTSLRAVCAAIEKTRKAFGNRFNYYYRAVLAGRAGASVTPAEHKELEGVKKRVDQAAGFMRDVFELPESVVSRVCNPFSLAQLYTLIETERTGFTSVCVAAHLENSWRVATGTDGLGAQCCPLPADSVRPFDGFLRRMIGRTAWEIAKVFAQRITSGDVRNEEIDIIAVIEQFQFAFTASLADIKKDRNAVTPVKAKLAQTKAERGQERELAAWKNKDERIRSASCGVCAFTGAPLGSGGEIAHIVPRSFTIARYGTVFESEANLIYVSARGAHERPVERLLTLRDLNDKYLQAVYGTKDRAAIARVIEESVQPLIDNGRVCKVDLLSDEQQRDVRHSLFLVGHPVREQVLLALGSAAKAKVNGTQAWFIKMLFTHMRKLVSPWAAACGNTISFHAVHADSRLARQMRDALAGVSPSFAKDASGPESAVSNMLDAFCAYGVSCGSDRNPTATPYTSAFSDSEQAERFARIFPKKCDVVWMTARALSQKDDLGSFQHYKQTIYGENFLPIHAKEGRIYVGFDAKNRFEVKGSNPKALLEILSPVLTEPYQEYGDGKMHTYVIDKTKAFSLFRERFYNRTAELDRIAAVLDQLRYVTTKQEVLGTLLDNPLSDADFRSLRPALANEASAGGGVGKGPFDIIVNGLSRREFPDIELSGRLVLPAKAEWLRIQSDKRIRQLVDDYDAAVAEAKKQKEESKAQQSADAENSDQGDKGKSAPKEKGPQKPDLTEALEAIWRVGSKRPLASARRVRSLPVLAIAGGLMRIERRTPDGKPLYQTVATKAGKYAGFALKKGELDWSDPVIRDGLCTKRVVPFGLEDHAPTGARYVPMTAWVTAYSSDSLGVELSPATKPRVSVRVRCPVQVFAKWIGNASAADPARIPGLVKLSPGAAFGDGLPDNLRDLVGSPRGALRVESVGEQVVFSYVAATTKAAQREAISEALKKA